MLRNLKHELKCCKMYGEQRAQICEMWGNMSGVCRKINFLWMIIYLRQAATTKCKMNVWETLFWNTDLDLDFWNNISSSDHQFCHHKKHLSCNDEIRMENCLILVPVQRAVCLAMPQIKQNHKKTAQWIMKILHFTNTFCGCTYMVH